MRLEGQDKPLLKAHCRCLLTIYSTLHTRMNGSPKCQAGTRLSRAGLVQEKFPTGLALSPTFFNPTPSEVSVLIQAFDRCPCLNDPCHRAYHPKEYGQHEDYEGDPESPPLYDIPTVIPPLGDIRGL